MRVNCDHVVGMHDSDYLNGVVDCQPMLYSEFLANPKELRYEVCETDRFDYCPKCGVKLDYSAIDRKISENT